MSFVTTHKEKGNLLKNQVGTGDRSCSCKSWIDHWLKYTNSSRLTKCIVADCNNSADRGAHVEFTRIPERERVSYIAPMCAEHNGRHGFEFQSKPGIKVARASVSETCGKR